MRRTEQSVPCLSYLGFLLPVELDAVYSNKHRLVSTASREMSGSEYQMAWKAVVNEGQQGDDKLLTLVCFAGYGGQYCAGTLTPIAFSQSMSGVVKPGEWSYFSLDLTSPTSRQQPLTINFNNDAGQGILLASFNNFPSLLSANFTFRHVSCSIFTARHLYR